MSRRVFFCTSRISGAVALVFIANGCVAKVDERRVAGPPRLAEGKARAQVKESENRGPRVRPSVSGEVIDVAVTADIACRSVELLPMEREETIERTITGAYGNATNNAPQFWNFVGAGLLAGIGASFAFGPCIKDTETRKDCSPERGAGQQTAGLVVMSLAAVPLAIVVINAIRAADDTEVVPVAKERHPRPWVGCATPALPNLSVDVSVAGTTLTGNTDGSGHALFDLAALKLNVDAVPSTATVRVAGAADTAVDIRSMASRERWEREAAEAHAARLEAERKNADDANWARADPNGCRGPDPIDPDRAETACASVESYVSRFSSGDHVAEARQILAAGSARVSKLRVDAAKRQSELVLQQKRDEDAVRRREGEERGRRVSACRGACVPQCKGRGDFVTCVQRCQTGCGS